MCCWCVSCQLFLKVAGEASEMAPWSKSLPYKPVNLSSDPRIYMKSRSCRTGAQSQYSCSEIRDGDKKMPWGCPGQLTWSMPWDGNQRGPTSKQYWQEGNPDSPDISFIFMHTPWHTVHLHSHNTIIMIVIILFTFKMDCRSWIQGLHMAA